MRTIKRVIPSKNDEETIGEDELLKINLNDISNRTTGCLRGRSLYLDSGGEYEVVRDDEDSQVLIRKKIKKCRKTIRTATGS